MDAAATHRMTADEFIAWAMQQPEGKRYELADGRICPMAPERMGHARVKAEVYAGFRAAIQQAGLRCEVIPDGMAVRVDNRTVYEPDAAIRCGEPLSNAAIEYNDPIVVVEVVSPSTQATDTRAKLLDYFRLLSVQHYLVADIARRVVTHHWRTKQGKLATATVASELVLDPPGLRLDVPSLFSGYP